LQRRVEAPLEADRGARLRRHRAPARRARAVGRVDLDAVVETQEHARQALVRLLGRAGAAEVGAPDRPHEERIAGEDEPRRRATLRYSWTRSRPGSTMTARPAWPRPTRYERHPDSSLRICWKIIPAPYSMPGPQCFSAFSFSALASLMIFSARNAGTSS